MKTKQNLKIGVVQYINALPLYTYLDYPVVKGSPRLLDQMMRKEQLDIALLPLVSSFENPHWSIYPDAGVIAACGPVASVLLLVKEGLKLNQIKNIAYTTESKTSVALTKIIFELLTKRSHKELEVKKEVGQADAYLEIGDKALFFDDDRYQKLDLAQIWYQQTGLPFVFASWTANCQLSNSVIDCFRAAHQEGLRKKQLILDRLVNSYSSSQFLKIKKYLSENIHYTFDNSMKKATQEFEKLCVRLDLLEKQT